jgi:hypothetical protein
MIQFHGSENRVWAMGKRRVFSEISTTLIWRVFSTVELMDENVLTGSELTRAARI